MGLYGAPIFFFYFFINYMIFIFCTVDLYRLQLSYIVWKNYVTILTLVPPPKNDNKNTPTTYRSDYIRNVGHCCARGSSQVHDFCPGLDMNLVYPPQDGSGQLRAEGVPGSVFNFTLTVLTQE